MFSEKYNVPSDFDTKCDAFCTLILEYNKTHNITGAKSKEVVLENIEDSIFPITFLDQDNIHKAIDVGTGAGFPGLLLAMALPKVHFTLYEPIKKKSAFLHLAKSKLKLSNVTVSSQRVEKAESFEADLISSRAVTNTNLLISLCKNFITPKTTLLFYKGENVHSEVEEIKDFQIYKKDKRNYLVIKDIHVA